MSIDSEEDLRGLLAIGQVVGLTIQTMSRAVRPGLTTAELDDIGRAELDRHGARSAPELVYAFPGATCISLNDEAAHGIPGARQIQAGDLVNIDVSAELDGYFADAAVTIPVPPVLPRWQALCDCTQRALAKGIAAARTGQPINAIGRAVEREARRGHGVGRNIHEEPNVPGFYYPPARQPLTEGLVITIEPFLTLKPTRIMTASDGWTLKAADGAVSVQFEHTIVISDGKPIVATAV
jgi:methionyl aminopeptidase